MKLQILSYVNALQDVYSGTINQPMIKALNDLESHVADLQEVEGKSTLEVESSLRENVRAYKDTLSDKECTITTLAMDLNSLGYIEQENKMLEADNLRLKSQLAMSTVNENIIRELRADNQILKEKCEFHEKKIIKLTGPTWFLD